MPVLLNLPMHTPMPITRFFSKFSAFRIRRSLRSYIRTNEKTGTNESIRQVVDSLFVEAKAVRLIFSVDEKCDIAANASA
jgi:hypothetical protein